MKFVKLLYNFTHDVSISHCTILSCGGGYEHHLIKYNIGFVCCGLRSLIIWHVFERYFHLSYSELCKVTVSIFIYEMRINHCAR